MSGGFQSSDANDATPSSRNRDARDEGVAAPFNGGDQRQPVAPERILMTTDTVGGVWSYSIELCRALQPFGVEVILATMGAPLTQNQRIEAAGVENIQVIESRYKLEWMQDAGRDLEAAGTWLELLEAQFAPDLIHLNGYAHAALPWSAPTVVVAHSDVLTWWEAVRGGQAPADWDDYAALVQQGLRSADVVVAPTHALLDAMRRHYGPLANARVIYNGRGAQRYAPREKEAFVLSAGRLWDEAKNAKALAAVAPSLGWPVKLAGDQTAPDGGAVNLRNVEILGVRPPGELAQWFARASIYAMPARYEPFGLTVLEAALSGCALVLGDIPTLRELWNDVAEFVPPDDEQALRTVLSELIASPERRAGLAARALEHAQQFSTDRMVRTYLTAYAAATNATRFAEPGSVSTPA